MFERILKWKRKFQFQRNFSERQKLNNGEKIPFVPYVFSFFVYLPFACYTAYNIYNINPTAISFGPSMSPTIGEDGELVVLKKRLKKYERGDVVYCRSLLDSSKTVCKRVIGVPGDIVPFVTRLGIIFQKVPEHHYYLLGDNPIRSYDSRHFGPVGKHYIKGKVIACTTRAHGRIIFKLIDDDENQNSSLLDIINKLDEQENQEDKEDREDKEYDQEEEKIERKGIKIAKLGLNDIEFEDIKRK